MFGIFVNENGGVRYAEAIVKGYKPIETRNRNMLGALVGKRVAVIRTRRNKSPRIVGYATIEKAFFCPSDKFDMYRTMTLIPTGSTYDCKGKGKWMYVMTNPIPCKPMLLRKESIIYHGRSYCELKDGIKYSTHTAPEAKMPK